LAACSGTQQTDDGQTGSDAGTTTQTPTPVSNGSGGGAQVTDLDTFASADDGYEDLAIAVEDAIARAEDGDFASARTDLQQLLSEPDVAAYAAYGLGVIAFYDGQEDLALDYFDNAMEMDPTLTAPLVATVRTHLRHNDLAGARAVIDRQERASEEAPEVRAVGLYVTLYEGRYEQVISDARALLLEDDDNLDAHYTMAMANYYLGRVELAEYILQTGLDRDPNRPDFYFALAQFELDQDNVPGAQLFLRRALEIDPHHPEAYNNLGVTQMQTRAYEDALDSFTNATRYAPDYQEAWLNLGNAYKGLGQIDEAQEAFEHALRIDDRYADPYFNLGVLYMDVQIGELTRMERCEQAIQYFNSYRERAGTLPPDHPVNEYLGEAETCVETELELANAPPPPEPTATDGCTDDFGFECFPGDDGCYDAFGDPCTDGGGGGG
ncbi:MAG: tetratricopeptide repeat protein, partial [Phycisphaerales bacterium]|nr:tetratricopeptide repeat protein [Phycisphaerales bacterium]